MYEGKLVRLRAHRLESVEQLTNWMNDPVIARNLRGGGQSPYTVEQEREWVLKNTGAKPNECHFAVETLDGRLIGGCSYHELDWRNRKCMVGWYIGDQEDRGKGYGTDMIRTLIKFCFEELNLRKVSLAVFEFNESAIRLYERLGFVREGTLRKEVFTSDRWWDRCLYGLFREEWDAANREE